jgi:ferric-dicitrate binding protein FerR (iron transport regulator)
MNITGESSAEADSDLVALLQKSGGRDLPPIQVQEAVWAEVHADWQTMLGARQQRQRRIVGWSMAATMAAVGCASLVAVPALQPSAVTVATIEHVDGRLIASSTGNSLPSIAEGEALVAGESLRTDAHSHAALRWPGGLSLRLDRDTAIKLQSPNSVALVHGAVYVDAPGHAEPLSIVTALGTVRHLGTQYIVAARPELLEVSIREGRISIDNQASSLIASAGERIRVSATGDVKRTTIDASDSTWQWTRSTPPTFQIDNQSLAAFLAWVSRQTGRPVVFESQQAESAAAHVILRGSIDGLDVDTALSVVLSTTQLHRFPTADDSIGIALNSP